MLQTGFVMKVNGIFSVLGPNFAPVTHFSYHIAALADYWAANLTEY